MKHLHAIVWKEGSWFVAKAIEVEVASQGRTSGQALTQLKEALELYFEDQPHIDLLPVEQAHLEEVTVSIDA